MAKGWNLNSCSLCCKANTNQTHVFLIHPVLLGLFNYFGFCNWTYSCYQKMMKSNFPVTSQSLSLMLQKLHVVNHCQLNCFQDQRIVQFSGFLHPSLHASLLPFHQSWQSKSCAATYDCCSSYLWVLQRLVKRGLDCHQFSSLIFLV